MGLLDGLLGNMMGGGGMGQSRGGSGSPLVKALVMLLAAKAFQSYGSGQGGLGGGMGGSGAGTGGGGLGGMLGGMLGQGGGGLPGGLGGLLGGGQAAGGQGGGMGGLGGLLGGGGAGGGLGGLLGGLGGGGALGGLLDQFRQNGYGEHVDSWVSTGQNRAIAPQELASALGPDTIDELEQQTGMPRDALLSELSTELPDAVDQFTPEGRVPSDEEITSRLYPGGR